MLLAVGDTDPVPAPWADGLLGFGTRLAQRRTRPGWQQVVVLTVPSREYAASLVGAGWLLGRAANMPIARAAEQVETLTRGDLVRMVTKGRVVLGAFHGPRRPGTIQVGPSSWKVESILAIRRAEAESGELGYLGIPNPGPLARLHVDPASWPAFFAGGRCELALVGARARLLEDFSLRIYLDSPSQPPDSLHDLLRPRTGREPAWGSSVVSGVTEKAPELDVDTEAAVLDGSSAIRWLPWLEVSQVVAVIDRSAATESAEATVMQLRASSTLVDPCDLGWEPLPGVECLAFEVKL